MLTLIRCARAVRPAGIAFLFVFNAAATSDSAGPFEPEIRAFEAADRASPPPKGAVLFIGSSSIRGWKTLAQDFPETVVINRGFGGSEIADSVRVVDRIVVPYAPRLIVMYAGGNDINGGKTAEKVAADFEAFVRAVRAKLPATPIAFISVAPNPARWAQIATVRNANQIIAAYAKKNGLTFIDVHSHMLGADGLPRPELYGPDRLHMNPTGYALWTRLVRPYLVTPRRKSE